MKLLPLVSRQLRKHSRLKVSCLCYMYMSMVMYFGLFLPLENDYLDSEILEATDQTSSPRMYLCMHA